MTRICVVVMVLTAILLKGAVPLRAESKEPPASSAVNKESTVTQGEFARGLVKALGWGAGLPEEPKDSDYLAVLAGKREFRFEAEETYDAQNDSVTVRTFPLFGPFSGTGWVSGIAKQSTVHFKVFLPRGGEYLFKVASKGDGQRWEAGGKNFVVNTNGALRETVLGTVALKAGKNEITLLLPPEGGIDYFELAAREAAPVEPLDGWHFTSPMTLGALAETAAMLIGREKDLPPDSTTSPKPLVIANAITLPPSVSATTAGYLGTFIAPRWVRAGGTGATLDIPFDVPVTGVYDVKLRYLGEKLSAELDGLRITSPGKPYLEWVDLGIIRLRKGKHTLKLDLPPFDGVDVLALEKRKSAPADYMALVGISGTPQDALPRADLERHLSNIVGQFSKINRGK